MYKSRCSSRFLLLFASPQPPSCILITRSSEHGRLDTLYALARIFGQIVKQRQRATMALIYFSNLTNAPKPVACLGRRFTTHRIHAFFFFFFNPLRSSFCYAFRLRTKWKPGRISQSVGELKVYFTTGHVLYETPMSTTSLVPSGSYNTI